MTLGERTTKAEARVVELERSYEELSAAARRPQDDVLARDLPLADDD